MAEKMEEYPNILRYHNIRVFLALTCICFKTEELWNLEGKSTGISIATSVDIWFQVSGEP